MSETLLTQLGNASDSFEGFLGELWTVWAGDAARAVLLARWSWQELPEELIQQAAAIQQQAQTTRGLGEIEQQVDTQLGAMGIFPGPRPLSVMSSGPGVDPSVAMFITVMSMIRAYEGDPPVSPASQGITRLAEAVLQGEMDPVDAMIRTASPPIKQQLVAAADLMKMSGMHQFLRLEAVVLVAFALPRNRIPVLLPEVVNAEEMVSLDAAPHAEGTPEQQALAGLKAQELVGSIVKDDIRYLPPSVRRILTIARSCARQDKPQEHRVYLWLARKRLYDLLQSRGQDVDEVVAGDESVLERIAREEGLWEWTEADLSNRRFGRLFKEYVAARRKKDQNSMNNCLFQIAAALLEVLWARGKDTKGVEGVDSGALKIHDLEERVRREDLYD